MFKRKKEIDLEEYEIISEEEYDYDEEEILSDDEIIIEDYNTDSEENINEINEEVDYLDEYEEKPKNRRKLIKRIINIVFFIIMFSLIAIAVDVIAVARYDKGPYFAIKTKTYKDGGSKEYYGIGYKVIKYNQIQGRRDKEIGLWNMPYDIEPTDVSDIDLAIEFTEDYEKAYKKYYKDFIRIKTTLHKKDEKNNQLIVGYQDEGKKYTLEIVCTLADKKSNIKELEEKKEISLIGTVRNFELKDSKNNNKLYISDCFAEH